MSLPKHLEARLTQSYPEMVRLEPEDLAQLEAYFAAPRRPKTSLRRLHDEKRRGVDTYQQELDRQQEFYCYLQRILAYNHSPIVVAARKPKPRGRPTETDSDTDRRVFDAWQSRGHKTQAEVGQSFGLSAKEVKRAIDRHRKRLNPSE